HPFPATVARRPRIGQRLCGAHRGRHLRTRPASIAGAGTRQRPAADPRAGPDGDGPAHVPPRVQPRQARRLTPRTIGKYSLFFDLTFRYGCAAVRDVHPTRIKGTTAVKITSAIGAYAIRAILIAA